jgi:2-methylaconitate cis-trans-isomerase PrpF
MARLKIPAVFVRGGTSKGVFFHERDLPKDAALRDRVILQALGSPDPYQRQLNGMGGGLSSLSKAVIIEKFCPGGGRPGSRRLWRHLRQSLGVGRAVCHR